MWDTEVALEGVLLAAKNSSAFYQKFFCLLPEVCLLPVGLLAFRRKEDSCLPYPCHFTTPVIYVNHKTIDSWVYRVTIIFPSLATFCTILTSISDGLHRQVPSPARGISPVRLSMRMPAMLSLQYSQIREYSLNHSAPKKSGFVLAYSKNLLSL